MKFAKRDREVLIYRKYMAAANPVNEVIVNDVHLNDIGYTNEIYFKYGEREDMVSAEGEKDIRYYDFRVHCYVQEELYGDYKSLDIDFSLIFSEGKIHFDVEPDPCVKCFLYDLDELEVIDFITYCLERFNIEQYFQEIEEENQDYFEEHKLVKENPMKELYEWSKAPTKFEVTNKESRKDVAAKIIMETIDNFEFGYARFYKRNDQISVSERDGKSYVEIDFSLRRKSKMDNISGFYELRLEVTKEGLKPEEVYHCRTMNKYNIHCRFCVEQYEECGLDAIKDHLFTLLIEEEEVKEFLNSDEYKELLLKV